jgi:hypothetical protein
MNFRVFHCHPAIAQAGIALTLAACSDQGYGPGPGPGYGPGYGSGRVQGHMVNALNDLQAANNELSQASHDKGGHRVNAIQLVNQAINEVNAGIAVGETHGD